MPNWLRDDGAVSVADWSVESARWGSHLTLLFYGLVQFNRMQLLFILLQDCTLVYVNVQRTSASVRVHRVVHNRYNFRSECPNRSSHRIAACVHFLLDCYHDEGRIYTS